MYPNHLFGIEALQPEQILTLLAQAKRFEEQEINTTPLRNRLVMTVFFEPSTRTRTSFEIAAKRLGAEVINLSLSTSSTSKGESLADTAKTLDAMHPDFVIVRHKHAGVPAYLHRKISSRIVNAGDGTHEHPTQALLDAYVLKKHWNSFENRRVLIIGDILHSRVARSNLFLLQKLGVQVRFAGPPSLCPTRLLSLGAEGVYHDLDKALEGVDAVMSLRLQQERMGKVYVSSSSEYFARFGMTKARLSQAKPGAFFLHPGPMNRGIEVDATLADSSQSLVLKQVEAGVLIRMAVLAKLQEATREE